MKIFIKTITGKIISLDIDPNDTIEKIKDKLRIQEGFSFGSFRLCFNGKTLNNTKTLDFYNIQDENTLLQLSARGN